MKPLGDALPPARVGWWLMNRRDPYTLSAVVSKALSSPAEFAIVEKENRRAAASGESSVSAGHVTHLHEELPWIDNAL